MVRVNSVGRYFRLPPRLPSMLMVRATARVTRFGVDTCSWPPLRFISRDIRFRVMHMELIRCARASFRVVTFGVLELGRDRIKDNALLIGFLDLVGLGSGAFAVSGSDSELDSISESDCTTTAGGTWFSLTDEVLSVGLFVFLAICCRRELLLSRHGCFLSGESRGGDGAVDSLDCTERELGSDGVRLSTLFRPFLKGVSRCRTFR